MTEVNEKALPGQLGLDRPGVLPIDTPGGAWGTVPELLFEKKGLIPALQQMIVSYSKA